MQLSDAQRWWARLYAKSLGASVVVNVAFAVLQIDPYPGAAWFVLRVLFWSVVFLLVDVAIRSAFGEGLGPSGQDV